MTYDMCDGTVFSTSTRHIKIVLHQECQVCKLDASFQVSQDSDGSDLFDESFSSFVNASFSSL